MQGIGVNNSVNSNIYAFDAARVLQEYLSFVRGDINCTVIVISEHALSDAAVDAIRKSVDKLGFGSDACAWVSLDAESHALSSDDVLEMVEGIDPISIVAADSVSAAALSIAYGSDVSTDAANRTNGRTVVAFRDFEKMLDDKDSKQVAWSLLKRL